MDWYYSSGNVQQGPATEAEILSLVQQGEIKDDTLVWNEDMTGWMPFSSTRLAQGLVKCSVSKVLRPESEMLQYGDSWVLPEHKDQFVQSLEQGGSGASVELDWGQYTFVNPGKRAFGAKAGIIAVIIYFFFLVLGFAAYGVMISSEGGEIPDGGQLELVGSLLGVVGVLLGQIPYMMWLHRVSQNAHVMARRELDQSPGWTVGFNYIPIMSLWKPYVAMLEIWNSSQNRPPDSGSQLVGWWWGMWLAANLLGGLLPILVIPAVILGWIVISKVTEFQKDFSN